MSERVLDQIDDRCHRDSVLTVIGVVQAPNCLAVFLNHSSRVQLRIDHDRVCRGVPEKSLDYVYGSVIVEMLGSENAAAVVWGHYKR